MVREHIFDETCGIISAFYNTIENHLVLNFRKFGDAAVYYDVSEKDYDEMIKAPKPAQYFRNYIRNFHESMAIA